MKRLWIAARSLIYMTAFLGLWGWIALSVRRFDPVLGLALPRAARSVGVIMMAWGGVHSSPWVAELRPPSTRR